MDSWRFTFQWARLNPVVLEVVLKESLSRSRRYVFVNGAEATRLRAEDVAPSFWPLLVGEEASEVDC